MKYSALAVANYFIDKANVDGDPIDHLRLQKMVYISHGWHLAIHGSPLISEAVEAWTYGPVIPSLYHAFKKYGNGPIASNEPEFTGHGIVVPNVAYSDLEARALLNRVWESYQSFTGVQLSNLTHQPGTPWDKAWRTSGERKSIKIKNAEIERHFCEKAGF